MQMEQKYQDYFNFIRALLDAQSDLPTETKMKMIKQQTKALIQQELNDYANDMTNQHNKYIEKLNTKLL